MSGRVHTHDTVACRSAHNVPIAISQMWESIVQNLPRRARSWSLLVCLLARRFAFEIRIYWKRVHECVGRCACAPSNTLMKKARLRAGSGAEYVGARAVVWLGGGPLWSPVVDCLKRRLNNERVGNPHQRATIKAHP